MTTKVQRVGLIPSRTRADAQALAVTAATWLGERGIEVKIPNSDVVIGALSDYAIADADFPQSVDVVVSLGGDGTLLHAVDLGFADQLPVLGVNFGRLGYLAEVEPENLDAALTRLVVGDFAIEERMILEVKVVSDGPAGGTWWALNEAVLEKEAPGRLVHLEISINGKFFTTYAADGVIIATSTGSTAYSFSVGGPIVSPFHQCILVTPVSPHMLFGRSLVLDSAELVGCVVTDNRNVVLTTDGRQIGRLVPGDTVTCTGSSKSARLITLESRDFHQILKAKFGLADR